MAGAVRSMVALSICALLVLAVLTAVAYWAERSERSIALNRIAKQVPARADARVHLLSETVGRYSADVRFLARSPALLTLVDEAQTPKGVSARARERLQTLFLAYAQEHREVLQVRLIGVAREGLEIVRVDRDVQNDRALIPERLQAKGDRDYFREGLKVGAGQVYVSRLDLNREFGKVQVPHTPTLRIVTPVMGADGHPFGVVVINLAMQKMLDRLESGLEAPLELYLLNADGDFLLHPDRARRFGFDRGQRYRWHEQFAPAAGLAGQVSVLEDFRDAEDLHHFVRRDIRFDLRDHSHNLRLVIGHPDADIREQTFIAQRTAVLAALAMAGLLALIAYGYRHLSTRAALKEGQLAAIVSHSNDAVIGMELNGIITQWNRAAEQMFGYPAAAAIGHSAVSLIVPDDRASEEADILRRISAGKVVPHFESLRRRRDGTTLDVSVTVSPVRTPGGEIVGAAKILRDISAQKAAERHINEVNANLEQLVEERSRHIAVLSERLAIATRSVGMAVWDWNVITQDLIWDKRMYELYYLDPSEHSGQEKYEAWRSRVHPEDIGAAEALLMAAVAGEKDYITEFRVRGPEGQERYISAAAIVIRDADGKALRVVGVNRDTTSEHLAQAALLEAKQVAERANLAKSQFLANMSHEIRTPMNAVLGMLQLLARTPLARHQADYLATAETSARTLLAILNDILDFSKVEAGRLKLDPRPFLLDLMLRDVGGILSASLGTKPVEVLFDVGPELHRHVIGDDLRLKQVLINLGGNAIKFTERGEVILSLQLVEQHAGVLRIEFKVRDTGIGISTEQQTRIFEGFSQAETSTTRRYGGTGLGLAISQRLVRLMGGELHLVSAIGRGSEFSFTLELPVDDSADRALPAPVASLHGLRLLLVDDNASARRLLTKIAESFGWDVHAAIDGEGAIREVAARIGTAQEFDVILVDWQMPGTDGWSTCQRIRELQGPRQSTLILMTTSVGREELTNRIGSEEPPQDGVLVKPITGSMLFDAVADARAGRGDLWNTQPSRTTPQARLQGLRILVVEDNLVNQQVARELLELESAIVSVASSGREGISAVMDADTGFDVVLMDVQMPDLDGTEVTRRIRRDSRFRELPIIAMTANAMTEDRVACLAAGMNDHVGKPFHLDALVDTILLHVRGRKGPQAPAADRSTAEPANPDAAMDLAGALERFGRHREALARQASRFVSEQAGAVDAVRKLLKDGDQRAAARALHSLKGVSATLGAMALSRAAAALEASLARTAPAADLTAAVDVLESAMQLALHELGAFAAATGGSEPPSTREDAAPLAQVLPVVQSLETMLREQNLAATDELVRLQSIVGSRHSEIMREMSTAVADLSFGKAAELVARLRRELQA